VHDEVLEALDRFDISGALETIWDYIRGLNRYVEQTKPWELAKDPDREDDLDRALYELADGLRIAAVALSAYLPETSGLILAALGQSADVAWEEVAYGRTVPVSGLEAAPPLFPRIDAPAVA
jgi:methionyl-tRNA synthetase